MKLLSDSYEEAKRLIGGHREELDKIAEYLIRKETITGKEFMKILRAVQMGLDIPENLNELELDNETEAEPEKETETATETITEATETE